MAWVVIIGFFVVVIAIFTIYGNWLEKGFRPRVLDTALSPDQLRTLFADKVARLGWKMVDEDNPLVAQSGLLGGRRQQISLQLAPGENGRIAARIAVPRFWRKNGMPYKAHTLRMRINAFLGAVRSADASVRIEG